LSTERQIHSSIPIFANIKQCEFQLLEKPNNRKRTKKDGCSKFPVENFNKISRFPASVLNVFNKRADEFLNIDFDKNQQNRENSSFSILRNVKRLLFLLR